MSCDMSESDANIREKFHKLARVGSLSLPSQPESEWDPVISIGTAADLVGLSVSALRKYEKEGLLIYHRADNNRRLLCQADIKRIKLIKYMIKDIGLNSEGIRRILALLPCWDLKLCPPKKKSRCQAVHNSELPCWMINQHDGKHRSQHCRTCEIYRYGAYCAVTMKMLLHHIDDH
jgi:MerR family transcriptional regulator/heat shock protein HspR